MFLFIFNYLVGGLCACMHAGVFVGQSQTLGISEFTDLVKLLGQ